ESFSFQYNAVASGEAALEELEKAGANGEKPYQLVILDWKMPGLDGLETAKLIKGSAGLKQVPTIIMVTAFGREEIKQQAKKWGLDAFLTKPVFPSVLFDTIMEVFSRDVKKEARQPAIEARKRQKLSKVRGSRILLVEDNLINRQVALEILKGAGMVVETASNGLEAVLMVKRATAPYDAVLMDIQMPEMDGYEATRQIRSAGHAALPIIAMTANAMKGDREVSLESGMNDHLAKPIEVDKLFSALYLWIRPRVVRPSRYSQEKKSAGEEMPRRLSGLNIESALKRLGGNARLLRELLLNFQTESRSAVTEIGGYLEKGDFIQAQRLAHNLKGVAGNIGAMKLFKSANDLVVGIRQGEREKLSELLNALAVSLEIVCKSVAKIEAAPLLPLTALNITKNDSPVDLAEVTPLVISLYGLLKRNNLSAGRQLSLVKDQFQDTRFESEIKRIEEAINKLDFKNALAQLETIAETLKITL
ncbi:MAG: response regulator, partial [Desulfocucumaceae bacterium]